MSETATWEERHAEWRAHGNLCKECERIERSMDGPTTGGSWLSRLLEHVPHPRGGERFQPPMLLGSALDPTGSLGLRSRDVENPLGPGPHSASTLKRAAERLELKIEGNVIRGPAQSWAVFDAEQERLSEQLDLLWFEWANAAMNELDASGP